MQLHLPHGAEHRKQRRCLAAAEPNRRSRLSSAGVGRSSLRQRIDSAPERRHLDFHRSHICSTMRFLNRETATFKTYVPHVGEQSRHQALSCKKSRIYTSLIYMNLHELTWIYLNLLEFAI